MCQWLANGPEADGFQSHLEGALDLIKHCGAESLQNNIARTAFSTIRGVAVSFADGIWLKVASDTHKQLSDAYNKRQATYLATKHWTTVPYLYSSKTHWDNLLDILLHIPALLQQGDELKRFVSKHKRDMPGHGIRHTNSNINIHMALKRQAEQYLRDCNLTIYKLQQWLTNLQNSEGTRLWWHSNFSDTEETSPDLKIQFSGSTIPGLAIYYWTGLLELGEIILDIRDIFSTSENYATINHAANGKLADFPRDRECLRELRLNISQTADILSPSLCHGICSNKTCARIFHAPNSSHR